jgi:sigma-B regulation protein RsbU (phosphoserine phosphatase)
MIFINFKSETTKYTIYGVLFGLLFPVVSSLFEAWLRYKNVSFYSIINVQLNTPLLWVIDTAPFFLGLFARLAGIRQDALKEKNNIINEELKSARIIQESFLPDIPNFKGLEICYRYIPVAEVSGDFLILNEINQNKLSIFIGDVSGHGISAALITSFTIVLINKVYKKLDIGPDILLNKLNKELINFIPKNKYLTGIYGIFNNKNKRMSFSFARGGHPYPIYWDSKNREAYLIKTKGDSLGYNILVEHEVKNINMQSGDVIFLFTDGIIEAVNKNDEDLGFKGLLTLINNIMICDYSLKKSIELIINKINLHEDSAYVRDDKVLVGILKK